MTKRADDPPELCPGSKADAADLAQITGCPRQPAQQQLAVAREQNNRHAEVGALTDLALIEVNQNRPARALTLLEEAVAIARSLGDCALESDVLSTLGWAELAAGQPRRAVPLLEQAAASARELGDRFAEKLALERLGHAHGRLGDRDRCLAAFHAAIALARETGDRQHEAELLWLVAVVHADLGERDQALTSAQAAVARMEQSQDPRSAWYAEMLRQYRNEGGGASPLGKFLAGAGVTVGMAVPVGTAPVRGPGLLRLAATATKAMLKFLGSGLQTASLPERERRLQICVECPHHTGLRCRLCGCFTNVKARLPYEECPVRKW